MPKPLSPGEKRARAMYAAIAHGHIDLAHEWTGWRLRGRWLISPEGDRITPERLRGLLFREALAKPKRTKPGRPKLGELTQKPAAEVHQLPIRRRS
jgi:hypothetical protein